MRHTGYDVFYTETDKYEKMHCFVCGSLCREERSLLGPTGWIEAVSKRNHWHDRFECPYTNEIWHDQAFELIREIDKTPSKRLADLMRLDIKDILRNSGCLE